MGLYSATRSLLNIINIWHVSVHVLTFNPKREEIPGWLSPPQPYCFSVLHYLRSNLLAPSHAHNVHARILTDVTSVQIGTGNDRALKTEKSFVRAVCRPESGSECINVPTLVILTVLFLFSIPSIQQKILKFCNLNI